jgi:hypothetical protein
MTILALTAPTLALILPVLGLLLPIAKKEPRQ